MAKKDSNDTAKKVFKGIGLGAVAVASAAVLGFAGYGIYKTVEHFKPADKPSEEKVTPTPTSEEDKAVENATLMLDGNSLRSVVD